MRTAILSLSLLLFSTTSTADWWEDKLGMDTGFCKMIYNWQEAMQDLGYPLEKYTVIEMYWYEICPASV